mgnify:CR=1 FL=1
MSLDKKIATIVLAGSLLGGCASTAPKNAGDLFLQYSNIAAQTQVLKEKTKATGNPFEYQINDIKDAYEGGFIKDFDQDFDNHYATLTTEVDKYKSLASELLNTFPSGINYKNIEANNCNLLDNGNYSCDIGTFKSGLLDARMASYVGNNERVKSNEWREWSNFSEPTSASIWAFALNAAFASKGGSGSAAGCAGGSSSTTTTGNTTSSGFGTTGSTGGSVGGTLVTIVSKGC